MLFDIHLARHRIQMKEIGVELCQTQFKEFKVILKLFVSYMSNFGIGYPMFLGPFMLIQVYLLMAVN